jgi:hypothetical protein
MHTRLLLAAVFVAVVAACSSKSTSSGTGGSGTGATTGTATTGTTGTGTTSATSGTGGLGGAGTTSTTTSSGTTSTSSTTTSTGSTSAGGSCATTPTFAEVLATPLSSCAGLEPPCHNAGAGNMTIDPTKRTATWKQLVNVPVAMQGVSGDRVVPGDPGNSFLYRKLTNALSPIEQPPMPEPPAIGFADAGWVELPPSDIEMVRCWILGGALNN